MAVFAYHAVPGVSLVFRVPRTTEERRGGDIKFFIMQRSREEKGTKTNVVVSESKS
jgi:hypothetical protein